MTMSKTSAVFAYIVSTLLMVFGWLGALAQGDAPLQAPRISGMVAIFVLALALLVPVAWRVWRTQPAAKVVFLAVIGAQVLICLFAITAEFML